MGIRVKGISDTKTLSALRGSGTHSKERHVRQFQIASLELERSRRMRELKAASTRVRGLEARLVEIAALIAKHEESLGRFGAGQDEPAQQAAPVRSEKRLTLRY